MTKNDLAEKVLEKLDTLPKQEAREVVDLIFSTMKDALADGETIKIHRFGTFSTNEKEGRTGRNPQTGEPIEIAARTVVRFKASDVLKERVRGE